MKIWHFAIDRARRQSASDGAGDAEGGRGARNKCQMNVLTDSDRKTGGVVACTDGNSSSVHFVTGMHASAGFLPSLLCKTSPIKVFHSKRNVDLNLSRFFYKENRGSKNNCFPNSPARLSSAYLLVGDAGGVLGGGLKVAIIRQSLSVKSTALS